MDRKKFRLFRSLIAAAVGVSIGWSISSGNAIVPLVATGIGMGLFYWLRKRVKEVIEDERLYRISEKASRITLNVLLVMLALAGVTFIALGKRGFTQLETVGVTLAYVASAFMVLYTALYAYFERKL